MRINRASDDAAGLAISSSLRANQRIFQQAIRNTNDGISLLNIAEGGVGQLTDIAHRLKELAESASNGSLSSSQRESINEEAQALSQEYNRIVESTSFNGLGLLGAGFGRLNIQAGIGDNGTVGFSLGSSLSRTVGSGEFDFYSSFSGTGSNDVEHGDVDGDGNLDVLYLESGNIRVRLGDGDGTFGAASTAFSMGKSDTATALAVADMDGDGLADIITGDDSGDIVVATADGDGTFTVTHSSLGAALESIEDIKVGDFDGDGKNDLAIARSSITNTLAAIFGNGDGTLSMGDIANLSVNAAQEVVVGDFDGDGIDDIVADQLSAFAFRSNGDRSFASESKIAGSIGGVGIGDINGDGKDDVFTYTGSTATQYSYDSGKFSVADTITFDHSLSKLEFADVNIDGHLDLLGLGRDVSVFFSNGDSLNPSGVTSTLASIPASYTLGDFDGDGLFDVIGMDGIVGGSVHLGLGQDSNTIDLLDLSTEEGALEALGTLDGVLLRISEELSGIGSVQSRLSSALNTLGSTVENYAAAESRIKDVDVAGETAALVKDQILQQAGAAVLSQANFLPQLAIRLLQST